MPLAASTRPICPSRPGSFSIATLNCRRNSVIIGRSLDVGCWMLGVGCCASPYLFLARYSLGLHPTHFLNVVENTNGFSYPHACAIVSTLSSVVVRSFAAFC